jgi:MoxR-like ATPase
MEPHRRITIDEALPGGQGFTGSAARNVNPLNGHKTVPLEAPAFRAASERILSAINTVIDGKAEAAKLALTVLLAQGHLLLEDVPGVGKTLLAKTLARTIDCSVSRIQFTPDLLPSDVTGVSIYNQSSRQFEFRPGAVFANIVIGDEINRASPKTQSALLECMEERQVTADGHGVLLHGFGDEHLLDGGDHGGDIRCSDDRLDPGQGGRGLVGL